MVAEEHRLHFSVPDEPYALVQLRAALAAFDAAEDPENCGCNSWPLSDGVVDAAREVLRVVDEERARVQAVMQEQMRQWIDPEAFKSSPAAQVVHVPIPPADACGGCNAANCSHLWPHQQKCCPDCTHQPVHGRHVLHQPGCGFLRPDGIACTCGAFDARVTEHYGPTS